MCGLAEKCKLISFSFLHTRSVGHDRIIDRTMVEVQNFVSHPKMIKEKKKQLTTQTLSVVFRTMTNKRILNSVLKVVPENIARKLFFFFFILGIFPSLGLRTGSQSVIKFQLLMIGSTRRGIRY